MTEKHLTDDQRQQVIDLVSSAEKLMHEAADLQHEHARDESLCFNCRLDAEQESAILTSAGILLEKLLCKMQTGSSAWPSEWKMPLPARR